MIESLETRWLFALPPAGHSTTELVGMSLSRGTLTITGWNGRDNINVSKNGTSLVVTAYNGRMTVNNSSVTPMYSTLIRSFPASAVARIKANLNGGNDHFFATLSDPSITLMGGSGSDRLIAHTDKSLLIEGQDGNDRIYGRGGVSCWLKGGNHDDYVRGSVSLDVIFGGPGNDVCIGSDLADIVYGEAGNDTLVGGFGLDTMYGNDGNDYLCKWMNLAPWGETVGGGDGMDAWGGTGDDTITFQGGSGASGQAYGGHGNDLLIGDGGNDTLDGGQGLDTFQGNGGDDTYYANDAEQDLIQASTGGGNDTIFSDLLDVIA
jgi:Ca2+-binding RTX toxin-like protein